MPETLASVKEQIAMLSAEHIAGLAKLQDFYVSDVESKAFDRYVQVDELFYTGEYANDADFKELRDEIEVRISPHVDYFFYD